MSLIFRFSLRLRSQWSNIARLARLIRYLKLSQIAYRLRNIYNRKRSSYTNAIPPACQNVCAKAFKGTWTKLDHPVCDGKLQAVIAGELKIAADLSNGVFRLLNRELRFADGIGWEVEELPRLWRFQLHSCDYMRSLAVAGDDGYPIFGSSQILVGARGK